MPTDGLARADPLAAVIGWLEAHPVLRAELGGPGRVGFHVEPPFPRLRVLDVAGGSDRQLRWLIARGIQIEAFGDLSGAPGKAALARVVYVALGALMEMPDRPAAPGEPVVTAVLAQTPVTWAPEPTGQPRYVASVLVYAHPG